MGRTATLLAIALAACVPPAAVPPVRPAPDADAPPPVDLAVLEPVDVVVDAPVDLAAHPPCALAPPELRDVDDPGWTPVLRDLARHIRHDGPWTVDNLVTAAHESTHLMSTQLTEVAQPATTDVVQGYYLLDGCGVVLVEPAVHKRDAIPYIPEALRGLRYRFYLPDPDWDDVPTYLFDEWIAYVNGSAAALELLAGPGAPAEDAMAGQVELTIYSLALGMAVRDLDPSYPAAHPEYLQTMAWVAQRALDQYRAGHAEPFWEDEPSDRLYDALRAAPVAAPLRAFVRDTWGEAYLARLLDLPAE